MLVSVEKNISDCEWEAGRTPAQEQESLSCERKETGYVTPTRSCLDVISRSPADNPTLQAPKTWNGLNVSKLGFFPKDPANTSTKKNPKQKINQTQEKDPLKEGANVLPSGIDNLDSHVVDVKI